MPIFTAIDGTSTGYVVCHPAQPMRRALVLGLPGPGLATVVADLECLRTGAITHAILHLDRTGACIPAVPLAWLHSAVNIAVLPQAQAARHVA